MPKDGGTKASFLQVVGVSKGGWGLVMLNEMYPLKAQGWAKHLLDCRIYEQVNSLSLLSCRLWLHFVAVDAEVFLVLSEPIW